VLGFLSLVVFCDKDTTSFKDFKNEDPFMKVIWVPFIVPSLLLQCERDLKIKVILYVSTPGEYKIGNLKEEGLIQRDRIEEG
jgi:hypothetical protein